MEEAQGRHKEKGLAMSEKPYKVRWNEIIAALEGYAEQNPRRIEEWQDDLDGAIR